MPTPFPEPKIIRQRLLRWYSRHKRDLPWRRTSDPYRIWVSEIMLQQTQVATVIPYYRKWLLRFPTLSSLAHAKLSDALHSWAGLGYYRRARMFHEAARHILKDLHGKIPQNAEALQKLPGIGRYTAGAIASIAFGEKTPVLDGNVIRILTRIFGIAQSVDLRTTLDRLWTIAASLLPSRNPGDMNQALMELGATVCFPFSPQCPRCPVNGACIAHKKNKEIFYPVRSRKEKYIKLKMAALALRNEKGEVWVEKQQETGRWGGLWMFPFWDHKGTMIRTSKDLGAPLFFLLTVQHGYTKYRITLEVYGMTLRGRIAAASFLKDRCGRWVSVNKLPGLAFPSPHRKIANFLVPQPSGPGKNASE